MATNNAVNSPLSGTSGTGSFAGTTSPTFVTPTLGAATATSVTFSPTTGGIIGTTTNDSVATGTVGEFVSSVIASGSQTTCAANTTTNVTSISLTAGDWNVWGNVTITTLATTTTGMTGWVSSSSITVPDPSLYSAQSVAAGYGINNGFPVPQQRFSLSGTTTIYLTARVAAASGNAGVSGGIYARRVR